MNSREGRALYYEIADTPTLKMPTLLWISAAYIYRIKKWAVTM